MKVSVRKIAGPWSTGYVLDKHMLQSIYQGDDANGRPQFSSTRSEVGEAVFLLKYRGDASKAEPLATAIAQHVWPLLSRVDLIVPMPASTARRQQPVTLVAEALGRRVQVPVFNQLLLKVPPTLPLKDLTSKAEKMKALAGSFRVFDQIATPGIWNVLLLDDLYDSGASMESACQALRQYGKVGVTQVVALTWKQRA